MYVYFKSSNSVLTCDEWPQLISVDTMKSNHLEHMCNKWEKNDATDNTFTLSFKHTKNAYEDEDDDSENDEYSKKSIVSAMENVDFYLQNSGNMDIVCAKPTNRGCQLCEVDGYPNIYKWIDVRDDDRCIFALHVTTNHELSDANIKNEIDVIKDSCHMTFVECV